MKYTKRVVSLFIIATMILSMLSAFIVVPVMAINAPGVYTDDTSTQTLEDQPGIRIDKGDKIFVNGTGVTAGETVNIYWDFVQAAYLLNTTTAANDGSYGCYIKVPEAYNGTHYIWAKDLSTGLSERSADAAGLNIWAARAQTEKDLVKAAAAIDLVTVMVDKVAPFLDEDDIGRLRSMIADLQLNYTRQA